MEVVAHDFKCEQRDTGAGLGLRHHIHGEGKFFFGAENQRCFFAGSVDVPIRSAGEKSRVAEPFPFFEVFHHFLKVLMVQPAPLRLLQVQIWYRRIRFANLSF